MTKNWQFHLSINREPTLHNNEDNNNINEINMNAVKMSKES